MASKVKRKNISASLKLKVFKRDNFTCQYCRAAGSDGANLEIDHIMPVAKGGKNNIDNLITACQPCNRSKGVSEWQRFDPVYAKELLWWDRYWHEKRYPDTTYRLPAHWPDAGIF